MKLQLQLQYNSVQNDKKDSQSQKDSSALDESHNISIFIFQYHGYRHIATPLTCISVASATSFTFNSFAVVNENMCQFSTQSTTAKEINNDFTQRTA